MWGTCHTIQRAVRCAWLGRQGHSSSLKVPWRPAQALGTAGENDPPAPAALCRAGQGQCPQCLWDTAHVTRPCESPWEWNVTQSVWGRCHLLAYQAPLPQPMYPYEAFPSCPYSYFRTTCIPGSYQAFSRHVSPRAQMPLATSGPFPVQALSQLHRAGVPVLTKGQLLDDNLFFCSENHRNHRLLGCYFSWSCVLSSRDWFHLPQGRHLWVLCQCCSPVHLLLVPALPVQDGWSYQSFLGSPAEACRWGSIRMAVTTCLHRWFQAIWKPQGFTEKLPVQLMAALTRMVEWCC